MYRLSLLLALLLGVMGSLLMFCDCGSSRISSILQSTLFIPTLDTTTKFVIMAI